MNPRQPRPVSAAERAFCHLWATFDWVARRRPSYRPGTMRACCSPTWSRPPGRWRAPPAGRRRSPLSRPCCGGPRRRRPPSSCRGCPASCGSAGPAWAGRRCATCPGRPTSRPSSVADVDAAFARRRPGWPARARPAHGGGAGRDLFGRGHRATSSGSCRGLVTGELRQGALDGRDGRRRGGGRRACRLADVRRALMLAGALRRRSRPAALAGGAAGAGRVPAAGGPAGRSRCWPRPPARRGGGARAARWPAAVEWKLDGIRVQVHRAGDEVARVHPHASTTSPPGCPRSSRPSGRCRLATVVLDGEAIALRPDGRPRRSRRPAARAAPAHAARRRCAVAVLLRRSCTSTAPTCWTRRCRPSAGRRSPRWCRRAAAGARGW